MTDDEARDRRHESRSELNRSLTAILTEAQITRIREARVYDGDLSLDSGDAVLFLLEEVDTAVSETSWGGLKNIQLSP